MVKRHIHLPEEVAFVLRQLNEQGFEAYVVGGCVRDSLLDRVPQDWDVTTSATPQQVQQLFDKTVDVGKLHGTVAVVSKGRHIEVTTYRIDGAYQDNRRPQSVCFTSCLLEDLCRRDFTMNAMAYHPDRGLVDHFNGVLDVQAGRICAVGNPDIRFTEDALRMLRAVRFAAQLNFTLSDEVMCSLQKNAGLIRHISSERVREELTKVIVSKYPMHFILLRDSGLLQYLLPEIEVCFHTEQKHPYHIYNVGMHILKAVSVIEADRILRWVMLLHDIGKPATKSTGADGRDHFYGHTDKSVQLAKNILQRLKFDNKSTTVVLKMIQYHDRPIEPTKKSVRRAMAEMGEEIFEGWLKVKKADMSAQNPKYLKDRLIKLEEVHSLYQALIAEQKCTSIKELAVNGHDLLALGFPQGRLIKQVLGKLLDHVLENPEDNLKEKLIALACTMK